MSVNVLILPGYGNSGPQHWQSLWQAGDSRFSRVMQRDWESPCCADWCASLEQAVQAAGAQVVIVAHSLGSLTVAHWAAAKHSPIRGALLVAVPDPERPDFPKDAVGFTPIPHTPLPFPSIVVASNDDPYDPNYHAPDLAKAWGSRLVELGPVGHINAASGLGDWSQGKALLAELINAH